MKTNDEKTNVSRNPTQNIKTKTKAQEVKNKKHETWKQKCKSIFIVINHENINKKGT
jgi:hypothetical protein